MSVEISKYVAARIESRQNSQEKHDSGVLRGLEEYSSRFAARAKLTDHGRAEFQYLNVGIAMPTTRIGGAYDVRTGSSFPIHTPLNLRLDRVPPEAHVGNLKESRKNQREIAETKMHVNADAPNQTETKKKTAQIRVQEITKTLKLAWSLLPRRGIAKEDSEEGRGNTERQLDLLSTFARGTDMVVYRVCMSSLYVVAVICLRLRP
ncbi:hypothetical protein B0H16DRAFT_1856819 [Mycena metata]|uniref:Uncharacterized protein n=1 Tax=Mycena metata TaxID=1033252 RepID=A0AAD7N3S2_9AGAR|nr:hypothetical protein B0H16DRAFT_1856819 [Mycena metata]